jgi:hypothetical protein
MKTLLQSFTVKNKKISIPFLSVILLTLFSSCSNSGIYSVIVSNPGIQHEQNDMNDLGEPYKKEKLVFPSSIAIMSEVERARWLDTLNQYRLHAVDTSLKTGIINTPGLAMLQIPACAKKGVAIIVLDDIGTRKGGKVIDVKMRYVCKDDNPEVDWSLPGKFWAATPSYKIDVNDECNDCYDGFQSVEFQFAPEKDNPLLRSVFVVCAKE